MLYTSLLLFDTVGYNELETQTDYALVEYILKLLRGITQQQFVTSRTWWKFSIGCDTQWKID